MQSSAMLRPVALVRTDVSERRSASMIIAIRTVFLRSVLQLLVTANVVHRALIVVTLMIRAILFSKHSFLQEPHGVTS
jgi:hypothetical protein